MAPYLDHLHHTYLAWISKPQAPHPVADTEVLEMLPGYESSQTVLGIAVKDHITKLNGGDLRAVFAD